MGKHYRQQSQHFGRKLQLFAAKGPAYHTIYGRWQAKRAFYQWRGFANHQTPDNLWGQLDLAQPALSEVQQALSAHDEAGARHRLATYFRRRQEPRFCFAPADVPAIVALVQAQAAPAQAHTIQHAGEILQNRFTFRGAPTVTFGDVIDWRHQPDGNVDWRWDLNRHTFWETLGRAYAYTGDERYVHKVSRLLHDWRAQNAIAVHAPNWESVFEVALRSNSWIWTFYLLRQAATFDDRSLLALVQGLWQHGHFLETFLEYHAQNNHLLLEAKALALVGLLFPECKAGARWRAKGLAIFFRELQAQVCNDGVHGERATLYHRIITGETLELLVLLTRNQISVPAAITAKFAQMVAFEEAVTKPDGATVLLGDSALTDVHLRFAGATGGAAFLHFLTHRSPAATLGEAELWLLGATGMIPATAVATAPMTRISQAFPEGGYFVMQAEAGKAAPYLMIDCGPFGYQKDATHGHADALSFELYAHGQSWLIDPGVYSTHLGWSWRRFFRGTAAHNTVVVDEQDQSLLLDNRRVYRPAQVTLHRWYSGERFDFFDGAHNGYQRLAAPVTHRRQIFFAKPEYWVVIDRLTGAGTHSVDLYFHLMADLDTQLNPTTGQLCAGNGEGAVLQIVPLADAALAATVVSGATDPIQGWVSLYSGVKTPAPTLRYRQQGAVPLTFCTVLYPQPTHRRHTPVTVTPLVVTVDNERVASPARTALAVESAATIDYLLIDATPDATPEASPKTHPKSVAGYQTDAELLYVRHRKRDGRVTHVVTAGGGAVHWQARPLTACSEKIDPALLWEHMAPGWQGWRS